MLLSEISRNLWNENEDGEKSSVPLTYIQAILMASAREFDSSFLTAFEKERIVNNRQMHHKVRKRDLSILRHRSWSDTELIMV